MAEKLIKTADALLNFQAIIKYQIWSLLMECGDQ
jgi:hypothetical protein